MYRSVHPLPFLVQRAAELRSGGPRHQPLMNFRMPNAPPCSSCKPTK